MKGYFKRCKVELVIIVCTFAISIFLFQSRFIKYSHLAGLFFMFIGLIFLSISMARKRGYFVIGRKYNTGSVRGPTIIHDGTLIFEDAMISNKIYGIGYFRINYPDLYVGGNIIQKALHLGAGLFVCLFKYATIYIQDIGLILVLYLIPYT